MSKNSEEQVFVRIKSEKFGHRALKDSVDINSDEGLVRYTRVRADGTLVPMTLPIENLAFVEEAVPAAEKVEEN